MEFVRIQKILWTDKINFLSRWKSFILYENNSTESEKNSKSKVYLCLFCQMQLFKEDNVSECCKIDKIVF